MLRRNKGFSLAELLVAMFVIIVGIAGVTSAIYWGLQNTDHGQFITQASNYGRVLMETLVTRGDVSKAYSESGGSNPPASSGLNDAANARQLIFAAPFDHLATNYGATKNTLGVDHFRRNISINRLVSAGTPDGLGGTHTDELVRVTMKIYYDETGTGASDVTRFNRFVELETIVTL